MADTRVERKLNWTNLLFIASAHVMAIGAVVYMCVEKFEWRTLLLGIAWFWLCGLGITGGYHRLFAHPCYKASRLLRAFYLFFGAASVQNSALKWSADHRRHHKKTDHEEDPYNIRKGFWWAHIGWVLFEDSRGEPQGVIDLQKDPLVRFQDRFYIPIAILAAVVVPGWIASSWGDAMGGVMVAGFLRLIVQWHATFAVNSVAHTIGRQTFSLGNSARDSFWTALVTLGEGYHNFHHRFQLDYRNGIRWYHFDPTKWFIWSLSRIGITWDLRRTPKQTIWNAKQAVLAEQAK